MNTKMIINEFEIDTSSNQSLTQIDLQATLIRIGLIKVRDQSQLKPHSKIN